MNYRDFISADSAVMLGKPVFSGTRIPVELVLRKMSEGMEFSEILVAYPALTKNALLAAISYIADILEREEVIAN
jgi:uncharacterized protein (DUF433 family)